MKKHFIMFTMVLSCAVSLSSIHADEDIFKDYNTSINKPAEANSTNVYSAWAENMANLIGHGRKKGIVINGEGDYAGGKVHADGVGNVVVNRGARITGPIINKTEIKNSAVVIKQDSYNRTR